MHIFGRIRRILIIIMVLSVVATDNVMVFAKEETVTEEVLVIEKENDSEEVVPDEDAGADDFEFVPGYVEISNKGPVTKVDDSISFSQIEGELNSDSFFTEPDVLSSAFPYSYTQTDDIKQYFDTKYPKVRNQGKYGTCWAHSAIGLAEFYMINHDMASPSVDLSELHLSYYAYNQGTPSIAGDTGDKVEYIAANDKLNKKDNEKNYLNSGGNLSFAAQTLMRQRGVALEETVPYSSAENVLSNGINSSLEREDAVYLKNAMEINISNTDLIKNYIKQNGMVGTSIFADDKFYDKSYNSFYCENVETNHAVALVGWDDNFPKEHFNSDSDMKPANNGAWLVRNSWGIDKDDTLSFYKYFWISYEDYALTKPDGDSDKSVWVYEMTEKDGYPDNDYYYDSQIHEKGWFIYGKEDLTVSSANVYKAKSGFAYEDIKAVGFSILKLSSYGTGYTIRIYTDVDPDEGPISGDLALLQTGTVYFDGDYTIDLEAPVRVSKDSYFTVVIDRDDGKTVNYETSRPEEDSQNGVTILADSQKGQSLYSNDNIKWKDCKEGEADNFTISALTDDVSTTGGGILLSDTSITINTGETKTVNSTVYKSDGSVDTDAEVEWSSTEPSIATVDENGKISAVSEGETYIIASYDGMSDKCRVKVEYEPGSALNPNPNTTSKNLYLVKGQSFDLIPFSKGTSSSDGKVLSISAAGKVTAKKAGSATIKDTNGAVLYNVYIVEPAINKKSVNMICGETLELDALLSGTEELSSKYPVVWVSDNPSVAYVDRNNKGWTVYAISKGNATVTAYINGKSYTSRIKVSDTRTVKLTGDSSNITLSPLQSIQLKLNSKKFSNVTWTSDLEMKTRKNGKKTDYYNDVAYITSSGKLTAIGPGTTTLTCEDNGTVIVLTVPEPENRNIFVNIGNTTSIKYYGVKSEYAQWVYEDDNGVIDKTLVEKNGKIKALKVGIATVKCKYLPYGDINDGFTYTSQIYVSNPRLKTDDKLTGKDQFNYTLSLRGGETYMFDFIEDDTYTVLCYALFTSAKPSVAYVDEYDIVHTSNVNKKTVTTLSIKINGKKISVRLEVNP